MLLLPYERLTIHSPLPPAEVHRRLAANVEPRRVLRWPGGDHLPHQAEVSAASFKITRVVAYPQFVSPHRRRADSWQQRHRNREKRVLKEVAAVRSMVRLAGCSGASCGPIGALSGDDHS